eukprot:gene3284-4114_t
MESASSSPSTTTIEPININNYLDQHFFNESFLIHAKSLKEKLIRDRELIISKLDELNNEETIDRISTGTKESIEALNQLEEKRQSLLSQLSKQTKKQESSIDTLCKYTTLINQLTRIKKYFQILLIIHIFTSKVKKFVQNKNVSIALVGPFKNLIELQHNLDCLKVPQVIVVSRNDDDENGDKACAHLSKVVDHAIIELTTILQTKMKDDLIKSLKEINWISLPSNELEGSSVVSNNTNISSSGKDGGEILPLSTSSTSTISSSTITSSTTLTNSSNINSGNSNNSNKDDSTENKESRESIRTRYISNFTLLVILQLYTQKYNNNNSNSNKIGRLWAIDTILEPLVRGFKYHFQTRKVTNIIEKPEWPLHHARKLIRDHSAYLLVMQQSLHHNGVNHIDVFQWFIAGIVEMVNNKFRKEVRLFLEKPEYRRFFYHTMDHIVQFQNYLQDTYFYPHPQELANLGSGSGVGSSSVDKVATESVFPVPFDIFQEEQIFDRWLDLEIKSCDEHFNNLFNNPDRFTLYFRDELSDLDQLKPTNSAFELISLLNVITDRYKLLTDTSMQYQFFIQIQLELLHRYKVELSILIPSDPFSWKSSDYWDELQLKECCSIYNSINYIIKVLKDWDDQLVIEKKLKLLIPTCLLTR